MIYRASIACHINPKVIIVMLQKEQGLVTSTKPSAWNFEHAMGQNCPDTPAGCSAATAGFWKQVYLGARQMQIYTKYPTSFTYRAGQYNTVKWAPSSSCGTSKVLIKNQATANLYNYTPYRPNIELWPLGGAPVTPVRPTATATSTTTTSRGSHRRHRRHPARRRRSARARIQLRRMSRPAPRRRR
ncbi:hypothetical protein [Microbacterium elymi]|uniref:Uncharacterized protein n=1 Tax=Microbacterium elymi TaxID=2909587 RepID=A0ABY5NKU6_9MICO|nr:hypothetical protein [Microbacterium elymi]UUT35754.1 hypothetical protein L2X98_21275 [Microbacterium elymi]